MKQEILVEATAKYVRTSPRKVAVVLDLIRGKTYDEASAILNFTNRKAAKLVLKTLKSAGANASNNKSVRIKDLYVSYANVSPGPLLKRGRIIGRSRVNPILKRTSHIKIGLTKGS